MDKESQSTAVGGCGVNAPRCQCVEASLPISLSGRGCLRGCGRYRSTAAIRICVGMVLLLQGNTEHKQRAEEGGSKNQAVQFHLHTTKLSLDGTNGGCVIAARGCRSLGCAVSPHANVFQKLPSSEGSITFSMVYAQRSQVNAINSVKKLTFGR